MVIDKANLIKNSTNLPLFNKIVNNLKYFSPNIHKTDNITCSIIIADRLKNFDEGNGARYKILYTESYLVSGANKRARINNMEINIDVEYIKSIWPLNNKCPIIEENFKGGRAKMLSTSPTIDRIDNTKGYIVENVMVISALANMVKNDATIEELEFILKNWENLENE